MESLDDGRYSVVVIEADTDPDDGVMHLELAITAGPRKGEVVVVNATGSKRRAIDLLGLPATLTVEDAIPRVVFED